MRSTFGVLMFFYPIGHVEFGHVAKAEDRRRSIDGVTRGRRRRRRKTEGVLGEERDRGVGTRR